MEDSKLTTPPYSRHTLFAFFVPFTVFGIIFSIVAIDHVARSPCRDVPIDYVYAVFTGFTDMGLMFGIISLVLVSLVELVKRGLAGSERTGSA